MLNYEPQNLFHENKFSSYPRKYCASKIKRYTVLTTIGGCDKDNIGTKFISTYDVHSDSWVKCKGAELPLSLFRPGVMKLDNNEVMVFGGEVRSQDFSSKVFIGQFEK